MLKIREKTMARIAAFRFQVRKDGIVLGGSDNRRAADDLAKRTGAEVFVAEPTLKFNRSNELVQTVDFLDTSKYRTTRHPEPDQKRGDIPGRQRLRGSYSESRVTTIKAEK